MSLITLTGLDLNSDPLPGIYRELAPNRGVAGGVTAARAAIIIGNKLASVGSGSLDGLGGAVNVPIPIYGGRQEMISRYGRKSELALLADTFWRVNKQTQLWAMFVAPGTGTATVDFTFATNADSGFANVLYIDALGERVSVQILPGSTPTATATAAAALINAQDLWPVTASNVAGVLTVASTMAGSRHDHYPTRMRISFAQTSAQTISKGSVTGGSTDDDFTNAILALETNTIYYQINPKSTLVAVSSTDNGIGEHLTAVGDWVSPAKGKQCVLFTGQTGSVAQATTVATSMNKWYSFHVAARNSDWSPGMLAAHHAAVRAFAEISDRGANLAGYGTRPADTFYVPDPFSPSDRYTKPELRTLLNNGVTPIGHTDQGKSYIVWDVTTQSLNGTASDYRSRPGHIPSVMFDFWETVAAEYATIAQPKIADDPKATDRPLVGFNYPSEIKALLAGVIDLKIFGGPATLDPSQRTTMKASLIVERLNSGFMAKVQIGAVRHNLKGGFLIEDVSPSI